jgi:uncharacterized protein with HEPN domain
MPPDRDPSAVLDIVIAGRRISDFIADQDFEDFAVDLKTQSAVLLQFLILGEAAKRLSVAFRDRHSEIPWSDIMRMRDKLIHHYEGVDLRLIWKTAHKDLPDLLAVLEPLAPKE